MEIRIAAEELNLAAGSSPDSDDTEDADEDEDDEDDDDDDEEDDEDVLEDVSVDKVNGRWSLLKPFAACLSRFQQCLLCQYLLPVTAEVAIFWSSIRWK